MRCETVMQKDLVCVVPGDSAQRAALLMREHNIGFLPVCDEERRAIGALTDRDLALRVCAEGNDPAMIAVADVMTRGVVACGPYDELTDAERVMAQNRRSRVMVVDDYGRLLGVISLADVVKRDSNRHAARTLRHIVSREYRF
jgi:CBS domain-containing protein